MINVLGPSLTFRVPSLSAFNECEPCVRSSLNRHCLSQGTLLHSVMLLLLLARGTADVLELQSDESSLLVRRSEASMTPRLTYMGDSSSCLENQYHDPSCEKDVQ